MIENRLSEEALGNVSGGSEEREELFSEDGTCPYCHADSNDWIEWVAPSAGIKICNRCDRQFRTYKPAGC